MDHHAIVREEFARQAETFGRSATVARKGEAGRVVEALGEARRGRVLDLACGPGLLAEALGRGAREVVAFDLTPEMLAQARARCERAGLANVRFGQGRAEALPFAGGEFDAAVTRLALHHFPDPGPPARELFRVLRPGGTAAVADLVSPEDPEEAALHNALEILRDPSHTRALPRSELLALHREAGFELLAEAGWETSREFGEWAQIANAPARTRALRVVMEALARRGAAAGIGLRLEGERLLFTHRWVMLTLRKL
ncbi:MAG: class I SAM-dependent methyltransferase [Candidatus Tectomicrobia bacterium]|nr:class I SAM-dependent methyltransferase [Candidatus Tectomicrobia bacterium]